MVVSAFTWQRYSAPLPNTAATWRRLEKITMAAEAEAPHPYAGMSVLDILWQELDDVMDILMEKGEPSGSLEEDFLAVTGNKGHRRAVMDAAMARRVAAGWHKALKEWGELRGQAQGLAFAIAILTNPYAADVPAVKKEAVARWEKRGDEA